MTNRNIPVSAAIPIVFGRSSTLWGWGLFSFLMIFAWAFGGNADRSFIHFMGDTKHTKGVITEVVETNMEINERSVWANIYQYEDEYGTEYLRDAFTTGYSKRVGAEVNVEYPVNAAQYGRIPGLRSAEFSSWMLLMFLLPAAALIMVYTGIRRGLQDYQLLKVGRLVNAKLKNKSPTGTIINSQPVYKLTFEYFTLENKKMNFVIKSHQTAHLEDDELERLFYNPKEPAKATLVDDLAGKPQINDEGEISFNIKRLPIKPILWPAIFLAPHIWYFVSFF